MRRLFGKLCLLLLIYGSAAADVWHIEGIDVCSTPQEYRFPSVAIENGNIIHVSYQGITHNSSSELKYAYQSGSNWVLSVVESSPTNDDLADHSSIALNATGDPCIAYTDNDIFALKYATRTGSTWSMGIVSEVMTTLVGEVALCLDNGDTPPSIAFSTDLPGGSDHNVMYARFYNSQWYISTIDAVGYNGYFQSMALASDNTPHVSYYDATNADLKYAYLGTEFWYTFTIDSGGDVGNYSAIAIDSDDEPHIVYEDYTSHNLKYAYHTASGWVTETVDTSGSTGHYNTNSIALDSSDNPHVSYFDLSGDCLKYAYLNGTTWEIAIVDSSDYAGLSSAICVDSNDNPHIIYKANDGDNRYLRHAYYGPSGINDEQLQDESFLALSQQIKPNPCSGSTVISFDLPVSCETVLNLYDLTGRRLDTLVNEVLPAGINNIQVDDLTSGIYISRLSAGGVSCAARVVVLE